MLQKKALQVFEAPPLAEPPPYNISGRLPLLVTHGIYLSKCNKIVFEGLYMIHFEVGKSINDHLSSYLSFSVNHDIFLC